MNKNFENSAAFAQKMDEEDELKSFRDEFYIPFLHGRESIYFTGNSLGLQPKSTQEYVLSELEDWANFGVEGHFHARNPWFSYHEILTEQLATIIGALPNEVVAMNQLTVNLHLLFASFYRPTKQKFKIICEAKAFPSDLYMLNSQVQLHGLNPEDCIIALEPKNGKHCISTEDIQEAIEIHKENLAIVFLGGVNYYSGQVLDMKSITEAAHSAGAICGFDLAHAAGNIQLEMHDWNVDFASWCSYKYLNSGPGGVSGIYIHEKYSSDKNMFRLAGWWGNDKENRFEMKPNFDAIPTAEGWQLSNAPVLSMAAHKASLDIFEKAGLHKLESKGKNLAEYLMFIVDEVNKKANRQIIEIITPRNENEHGCQVSMLMHQDGKKIFEALQKKSVIADWRKPNVIRVAPVPLYNTYSDVFQFGEIIQEVLNQ